MGLKRYFKRFRAVISLDGDPYLVRYRLLVTKWFCIYLHHILRSDRDRNLHDHPSNFTTVILWGGYWEHALRGKFWRGPGNILPRRARALHRIELPIGKTAWTLFFRGPKQREWGFQTPEGWVPWYEYEDRGEMTGRDNYES